MMFSTRYRKKSVTYKVCLDSQVSAVVLFTKTTTSSLNFVLPRGGFLARLACRRLVLLFVEVDQELTIWQYQLYL